MADPRLKDDRLAPSLLDRLIDLDPDLSRDPDVTVAETPSGLRASLRRDLEILLNTRCLPATPPPSMPELADSLVSLGVEDFFAASLVTDGQRNDFARRLQARIARFEPRLENLSVAILADPVPGRRGLRLRIAAHYRARPGLPPIVFETRMDPVAGHFKVVEGSRG
ncbi:type VI secretion system baseplate subunit TssE [Tabrizicola sp.]|uniref:type VI secretion system baseplate subunit TssE n=1 Tax=Tabrizicola sp. TaxID=2005166 RepID=UPI003F39F2E8